jgi:hypothetical protein
MTATSCANANGVGPALNVEIQNMGCSGEIMTAIFIVRVVADSVGEYAK